MEKGPAMSARCRGFTLIEIMAALAVLALLAAIGYPSYRESVRKARRAEGRAALMQAMQQQESHYLRHGTYAAFSSGQANGFKWYSGSNPQSSAYEISASACDGQSIGDCVLLTAQPGTEKVHHGQRDDACGSLMLSSTGKQAASGGADCW
jgi:type IV pilus assembly protein PilE